MPFIFEVAKKHVYNPSYPNVAYGGIEFIVAQTIPLCLKKL